MAAPVYMLFWTDVEDCTVPQSDDAAKRLAMILDELGIRGTFKLVGQKARVLEQRIRYDVIDWLRRNDIGFHSNWHGLRPQIAEYLVHSIGMTESASFLATVARELVRLLRGEATPPEVHLRPVACRFEEYVDEEGARSGWGGAMLPTGFAAPKLIDLAKLAAWTLKPALLHGGSR